MILQKLQMYQFRNYAVQSLDFGPDANLIMGPNGQGKTNLLEAVTLLGTTKSPRAGRDAELISWDKEEGRVWGDVRRQARPDVELEIRLSAEGGKRVFINKASHPRLVELIGQLNLVAFWVEDIEIARGDPSVRRRFLNTEICQVSPQYCYQLAAFKRVLEQRNRLLKEIAGRGMARGSLPIWNQQLITYGAPIIDRRREFIRKLQVPAAEAHQHLTGGAEHLELSYQPSFPVEGDSQEEYERQLAAGHDEEIRRGVTLFGPHRDDFLFLLNGRDVRVYGSLGQQRSVVLSLKLAELNWVKESIGEEPVVLMDDIFAELDRWRVSRLMERVLPERQAIIATTEAERLPADSIADARRFAVCAGSAERAECGSKGELSLEQETEERRGE